MPLFVRKSDGEGVFIEPAARRSNRLNADEVVEARQGLMLRLQEVFSLREIADIFRMPVSTVRDGIAAAIQNRAVRALLADPEAAADARLDAALDSAIPPNHL